MLVAFRAFPVLGVQVDRYICGDGGGFGKIFYLHLGLDNGGCYEVIAYIAVCKSSGGLLAESP